MEATKKCGKCKAEKLVKSEFYTRSVRGKRYPSSYCKVCHSKSSTERMCAKRKLKSRRAFFVVKDCRIRDSSFGATNDLDEDFVSALIENGCAYCGASHQDFQIGLDRIDNSKVHMASNVVPCCTDCNLTRGNMPHTAWLLLAAGMKKARSEGLLIGWSARIVRKPASPPPYRPAPAPSFPVSTDAAHR